MQSLNIPIILGTGRKGRASERVAHYVLEHAKNYGFQTKLLDVRDFVYPTTVAPEEKERAARWQQEVAAADGFIVVVPEYNHGFPGELKMVLDQAYSEYGRKVVGMCGVSSGGIGGARVVELLIPVFVGIEMVISKRAVYFSNVEELFDAQGNIVDPSYALRLKKLFDDVAWYAAALKAARHATTDS